MCLSQFFFGPDVFWKVGTTQYAFLEKQDEKITGYGDDFQQRVERVCSVLFQ